MCARERVRVASVSVVWIGGLEFSECDGLEDSFGLRCSIFAIKTNKSLIATWSVKKIRKGWGWGDAAALYL